MLIDSHCHLADEVFVPDLAGVVERARGAGLGRVLCILAADDPEELRRAREVARHWPEAWFAAGVHPHRAGAYGGRVAEAVAVTRRAVTDAPAVAVGEIGLDYHYDFSPKDIQRDVFAAQVALAVDTNLPVVIHTREATDDTVAVLREAGTGRVRGVMHCFSGTADEARMALDLGFFISLSGIVTFPKAAALRDVARVLPADRLLVETDAPYLAPVPHRGRRNEPSLVVETLRVLAEVRQTDAPALAAQIASNFTSLFGRGGPRG
jgi:TatD DNase family protein